MNIIEGDYSGKTARVINAAFKGPAIEVRGEKLILLKKDVETVALLNKSESRTAGQLLIIILLAITVIGLLLAIPLFIIWKRIDFSVGIKTNGGKKFVGKGDASEWKIIREYVGKGQLDSF